MLRFIVLVTLNYAWAAICPPYVVTYGLSRGYSQSQVSIGVSLEMLCLILGNVLWGRISDHFRTNKRIWMLCMTIAASDVFFLFTSRSYGGFLAGFCLLGTVNGATGILMDTWVLKQLGNDIAKYGRIRSFGAAGYAAAMLAAGFIIKTRGYFALAAVSLMIWAAAVGIALFLAEKPWETAEGTAGTPLKRKAGEREISGRRELFRDFLNRDYLLWLLLLFLAGMAIAPCNNLKIVILGKFPLLPRGKTRESRAAPPHAHRHSFDQCGDSLLPYCRVHASSLSGHDPDPRRVQYRQPGDPGNRDEDCPRKKPYYRDRYRGHLLQPFLEYADHDGLGDGLRALRTERYAFRMSLHRACRCGTLRDDGRERRCLWKQYLKREEVFRY